MVVSLEEVAMHPITIRLSDDRLAKLQEIAARLHISPEELVRASVEELLARPEETCQRAIEYVLKKNAELYSRLA
jgi:predicted transcriptional regulator